MSKENNSQGYITFRNDRNVWCARYKEYDVKQGKNITKSKNFKTREEAEKYLQSIMYQKENPLYISNYGIPFNELMRNIQKLKLDTNQLTEITYFRNLQTIEQIEKFPMARKRVDEITVEEIQEFMNYHTYLSNSSINKLYHQIGSTFKVAFNRGYILRDPMVNVLKPKSKKIDKKVRALTYDEQKALTDFLLSRDISNCKYKNVYLLQMFMGLRVSEALALTFSDIDLEHKRLYVKRTLTKDENGCVIMGKTTKTYAGNRVLAIPDFMISCLLEQMKFINLQGNNDEKLLFKPEYKRYTDRANVNIELKRLLKHHFGIEDITTHCLRHTFATRCIESGMSPVVVQKLMGHTDISVTINTYTSVYDNFKAKEIEKVNEYYLAGDMLKSVKLLEDNSNTPLVVTPKEPIRRFTHKRTILSKPKKFTKDDLER